MKQTMESTFERVRAYIAALMEDDIALAAETADDMLLRALDAARPYGLAAPGQEAVQDDSVQPAGITAEGVSREIARRSRSGRYSV